MSPCAQLLSKLIAFRTHNPGGDELALCGYLADELSRRGADEAQVVDVPRGGDSPAMGAYTYATFGTPKLLVNVHIDTVPANSGWTRDPFAASVEGDKLYGLGAADTKGAAAAVLIALERETPQDVGILFSGDEERATTCVNAFIASARGAGLERAIVCEPTGRAAGLRHRGVGAYRATYRGLGGHSSAADRMPKPIVTLARLAVALDELGASYLAQGPADMPGICMNIAGLDGGVAFNVVPDSAELTWSVRPPPGLDVFALEADQLAAARAIDPGIDVQRVISHAPFACKDEAAFRSLLGKHVANYVPLQFWTEAAILAEANIDAVVVGPGDIAMAHAADEYVPLADLDWAVAMFEHIFSSSRG